MKYIETHAHYNDDVYKENLDEVLENSKEAGVEHILNVGYSVESSKISIDLGNKYNNIYSIIGIHPHSVEENPKDIYDLYINSSENEKSKIVAIGEIGLDYAFVKDNKEEQKQLFIEQINIANKLKLPIVIHSRDASLDTYNVIKENKPKYGALFHCFQPSDDLVKLVIKEGYNVAFGGNITYKRNTSFERYIKKIPVENMMIETDAPYLSPEPYRGQINTSANLPIILKKLAEFKEINEEKIAEIVYNNSIRFFNLK